MRDIVDISKIYNSYYESENYRIEKYILTHDLYNIYSLKDDKNYPLGLMYRDEDAQNIGKEIVSLVHKKHGCIMSSNAHEIFSCKSFIDQAYGDVLNFGLGLGIIIFPLLNDPIVKSIKIIESDEDLIKMISPLIKLRDYNNKVSIIHGDAFTFHKNLQEKFDTIFFDIWPILDINALKDMEYLHTVYAKNLKTEKSLMTSWCYDEIKKYFNS